MFKKFTLKAMLMLAFFACLFLGAAPVSAQVTILSEDFESVTAPALPAMWTTTNPNGGDLFITGDNADVNAGGYWVVPANGQFAFANDDLCNCDMSEVRMILPALDLTSFASTTISAEVWSDQFYTSEENTLEVSLDNGATWTTVGPQFPVATAWQNISYDLSAYDGMSNVTIAFRHDDVGGWGQGLAVNDVLIEGIPTGPTCFFSEDFEGVTAPALPAMWTTENPNGGDLFITGDEIDVNAGGYWTVPANGQFAFANDDLCNCDMSEVRLILPPQDLSTWSNVTISAQIWSDQFYTAEENTLEVSLDNGATWTTVGAQFPVATAWQDITYDLSAYDGLSNVLVAFRHDDIGGWGQGLIVNDVCMEGTETFSFCEDFEGVTAPALPAMWTTENPNGGDVFITGNEIDVDAGGYWTVPANGQFAFANDDLCNCDMSEVRLILPPQDFTGFTGMKINAEVWSDQFYTAEENSLEVSLDNGATWTQVGPLFPVATAYQDIEVSLAAYDGMSNVLIAFRHNDIGGWGQGLIVNDVCVTSTPPNAANAVVEGAPRLNAEYTIVPLSQETPALISAEVRNDGGNDLTNVVLTSSLFEETDPVTPVAVLTSTPMTITQGSSMLIDNNPGALLIGAVGRYYVEHVVTHDNSADETETSNDTLVTPIFELSEDTYARNDTSSTDQDGFGIGTGGGNNAIIGQNFEMVASGTIAAVEVVINGDAANSNGEPVSVAVYACDANGIPQTPALDTTEVQFGTDATVDETFMLNFDTPLFLATGTYFFGALEEGTGNIAVQGYDDIYTAGDNTQGTNWVTWDGNPNGAGVFTEPTTIVAAFNVAYHIRPIMAMGEACSPGSLAGGGAVASVCGTATTFNFATDGTEQIPSTGAFGWDFTPGANAGGGVATGFSITDSAPNIDWDADLGGVLSANMLSPLTGTWIVTGFSYADITDPMASLCGTAAGIFEITFSPDIDQTATTTDASTSTSADGGVDLTVTGGLEPFTYQWSNAETTEDLDNVLPGDYTVTVTDAAGCESISMWTVDFLVGIEDIAGLQNLSLFPNPADAMVFIQLDLDQSQQVMLDVFSVTGQKLVSFPAEQISSRQYEINTGEFQAGVYLARFTINGEIVTKRFTIAR